MIDKYKNLDPQTRKTVSLAFTLLIVIILSLVVLYVMSTGGAGDDTGQQASQVEQIESTEFNQAGQDYIDQTSTNRPSLESSLGKPNPFADYE